MNKEMLKKKFYAAVKEVNIATASHSAPVYSHEEILECRGITELRRLGRLLKVKYYGKLSKQELIPKIVEAINRPAMLRILLNQLERTEWPFFMNAIAQKVISDNYFLIECYASAQHMGILQSFYYDNQLCLVVPNEIKATFKQLEESGYVAEKDFRLNVIGFATAAINLYGVISQDDFVALYNSRNERQTNIDEVFSILVEQVYDNIGFCFWDEYLVEDSFEEDDFEGIKGLLAEQKGKPRYVPPLEEFMHYSDWDYFQFTPQLKVLQSQLNRFNDNPDEVLVLLEMIHDYCVEEAKPQIFLDFLAAAGVTFKDKNEVYEMLQLLIDVQNNTRLWRNNGHTPNELIQLFGKSKITPFPANRIAATVKVGRNDPCPCGSGKKYKNCCDK